MLIFILLLLSWMIASADEAEPRHGSLSSTILPLQIAGGLTAVCQNSDRRDDAVSLSFDLLFSLSMGQGLWRLYLEGNNTPQNLHAFYPDVNADAGSALDKTGKGRMQISELHYQINRWHIGLINPAGFLDSSAIANDETSQFLGRPFVNNRSIAFPDYAVGFSYHQDARPEKIGWTLLVVNSKGLADRQGLYNRLFEFDGLFAALEAYGFWADRQWQLGIWLNSDRRTASDGQHRPWGIYANLDGQWQDWQWNGRLGWANQASSSAHFASQVALSRSWQTWQSGMGLAYHRFDDQPQVHFESYIQKSIKSLLISADLQWIADLESDHTVWVMGSRLTFTF